MVKKSINNSSYGPISKKIVSGIIKMQNAKVIDFSEIQNAQLNAKTFEKSMVSSEKLSQKDPLHAVYVYAQNMISGLAEQLATLPELSKLADLFEDAIDIYKPSGPPMSPLTGSYFYTWGFFDLWVGVKKETFGTVAMDVLKVFGVDELLLKVFESFQDSRMGIYVHEGTQAGFVLLRELITGKKIKAVVPSGHIGKEGEIWFVRVLPEILPEAACGYSVVFTTPYVLMENKDGRSVNSTEADWLSFFDRNLQKTKIEDKVRAYEFFMKYGLSKKYWNEYIFEAYVNYKTEVVFLAGFPDIASSRPHSTVNSYL